MTAEQCTQTLEALPKMKRAALRQLWEELFGKLPHPRVRRELLIPILAYRVQEKTYGGLKTSTRNFLRKVALEAENDKSTSPALQIKSGTRLIREWHGERHDVVVTEHGHLYKGREYKTLSEVARLITGNQWSGPLFFGLKKRSRRTAE